MIVNSLDALRALRMVRERLSEAVLTWEDLPLDDEAVREYVDDELELAEGHVREAERIMVRLCRAEGIAA